MQVTVDQIWATPSTLHMRVLVHADDRTWRHKYLCSIPVDEVPEEAVEALTRRVPDSRCSCDEHQAPLF